MNSNSNVSQGVISSHGWLACKIAWFILCAVILVLPFVVSLPKTVMFVLTITVFVGTVIIGVCDVIMAKQQSIAESGISFILIICALWSRDLLSFAIISLVIIALYTFNFLWHK